MTAVEIKFCDGKKKPLITSNKKFISANDLSLTEHEMNKARIEIFETEEKKKNCLRELKSKLANDPVVNYRTDANYLLRYLRVRKFDCSKAYQNIKDAYAFKRKHPEALHIPSNLESLLNLNFTLYLPYTDEKGNIMLYVNLDKWNHQETSFMELLQLMTIICDIISMNPRCQVNGVIGIWDVKKLNKHHVAAILSNIGIGAFNYYFQKYFPFRVKNVFVVNTDRLSRLIYAMSRPFLSRKISERVVLLGSDMDELHQHVNPVLLPKTLGGSLEENQYNVTQDILNNVSYLKYERFFV